MSNQRAILAGLFLLCLCSAPEAREYQRLAIIGDSISEGVNPDFAPLDYGWTQMLLGAGGDPFPAPRDKTLYTLWPVIDATNAGTAFDRAADWAPPGNARLTGVLNYHPDLVIMLLGGWDVIGFLSDGNVTTAEKNQLFANLSAIVTQLQANSPKPDIVLLTYYDLLDGRSTKLPLVLADYRPLSQMALDGNTFIRQLAADKGCRLVDLYPVFFHHCYGRDFGDSGALDPPYVRLPASNFDIHPNTLGHEQIYLAVYAMLAAMKAEPERFTARTADLDQSGSVDAGDLLLMFSAVREHRRNARSLLSFAEFWGQAAP